MSPLPDMRTQAIAQHEVFISYIEAGFTREEALDLVKTQLIAMIQLEGKDK